MEELRRARLAILAAACLALAGCASSRRVVVTPPPVPFPVEDCQAPGWADAAHINESSLRQLPWEPFGRREAGWEVYAPLIAHEIGSRCAADAPGFASAFAVWEESQGLAGDGLVSGLSFTRMKGVLQGRRPIVLLSARGICAAPADPGALASSRPEEGYGGKVVQLRPAMLAAYRHMVLAARAEDGDLAQDPESLKLFSGFRSPDYDAARCATEQNCNGVARAACSPHRTGLAMDIYVGHAPGYPVDSSADVNRLAMTRTPAYRWLLGNAFRFGFVNYAFEPWHWEWTGEAPQTPASGLPAAGGGA